MFHVIADAGQHFHGLSAAGGSRHTPDLVVGALLHAAPPSYEASRDQRRKKAKITARARTIVDGVCRCRRRRAAPPTMHPPRGVARKNAAMAMQVICFIVITEIAAGASPAKPRLAGPCNGLGWLEQPPC